MWRLRPTVLTAAVWALWASRVVRARARRDGVKVTCPVVWPLPYSASPGVLGVLTRLSPTCLERSLVLQAWLGAHGHDHDVIVAVPVEGIGSRPAHAWVDGVDRLDESSYREVHRYRSAG